MRMISQRTFVTGILAGTCIVALAASAAAQTNSAAREGGSEEQQQQQSQQSARSEASGEQIKVSDQQIRKEVTDINKASKLIGTQVKNTQDENLGRISDLAIDLESGKVAYAVLSAGGVLGMGGKKIAVPLQSLTAKPGEEYLVIDATKERIEQAPGFADNNWPNLDQVQDRTFGFASTEETSRPGTSESDESRDSELQPTGGTGRRYESQDSE